MKIEKNLLVVLAVVAIALSFDVVEVEVSASPIEEVVVNTVEVKASEVVVDKLDVVVMLFVVVVVVDIKGFNVAIAIASTVVHPKIIK